MDQRQIVASQNHLGRLAHERTLRRKSRLDRSSKYLPAPSAAIEWLDVLWKDRNIRMVFKDFQGRCGASGEEKKVLQNSERGRKAVV
jgi:hypothetical protein